MEVVYARQPFPSVVESSIFLAGPTPRDSNVTSWRPEALRLLDASGYTGHVFVPEDPVNGFRDWEKDFPYEEQVAWEESALHRADVIVFWLARELAHMPAFTTNDEFGFWKASGKVILGTPPNAEKVRYQRHYAKENDIPLFDTLEDTLSGAIARIGYLSAYPSWPARRWGACQIPLHIWQSWKLQMWYSGLVANGGQIERARVVGQTSYFWAMEVTVSVNGQTSTDVISSLRGA